MAITLVESDGSTMAATRYSLRDMGLSMGQSKHAELSLELEPYRQGGFEYSIDGGNVMPAQLDIAAMGGDGMSFRLRYAASLRGPCSRCLEEAVVAIRVNSHEVHDPAAVGIASGDAEDELTSEFVAEDDHLDVSAWAQDALGLEFPARVLCMEKCRGLCSQCGTNLNEGECHCVTVMADPRWDKLKDLQLEE